MQLFFCVVHGNGGKKRLECSRIFVGYKEDLTNFAIINPLHVVLVVDVLPRSLLASLNSL